MPDTIIVIFLVLLFYLPICVLIAFVRALLSDGRKRKENFKNTFRTFFLEILNPFNWFG